MAGVRLYTNSYGSPGDVEFKECIVPVSLEAWKTLAKEATKEDGSGFAEVETTPAQGSKKILVNVNQVEWVYQL